MIYTVVALKKDLYDQLLKHAPVKLRMQAKVEAARVILGLCYTEDDLWYHCEQDERWNALSPEAQTRFVESLMDSEYEYASVTANEAISEVVEQALNEELAATG